MQSGVVPRSAEVVLSGHGKTVKLVACDLVGKGCRTLNDIKCEDGSTCLKVGGTPGCGVQSVAVPEGVVVYVYSAPPFATWASLCSAHKPSMTLTGPTTASIAGSACGFKAELKGGYTCETKNISSFLSRLGLDGPHSTYIIGGVVIAIVVVMMVSIKKKEAGSD